MLSAFVRAFKTPDLRKKLLFTLGIMALFRLGSHLPTPGVDYTLVQQCLANGQGRGAGMLGFADLFSGGALLQLSVFALGIMPYITASIIIQLLTVVIPRFEELKKEGQAGQTKMTQYTRYLTIALAVLQSATMITFMRGEANLARMFGPGCNRVLVNEDVTTILIMVLTMTAGTGLIMWLGELITEHGVGNGMSLLIFTAIVSRFPNSAWSLKTFGGWGNFIGIIVLSLIITVIVVYVEQAQRRIPVQYAKRMVGRRMYGGTSTYVPLKINMANVIPIIFASSLLQLPMMAAQFAQPSDPTQAAPGWVTWVMRYFGGQTHPAYMAAYFLLVIFFVFFYVSVQFNPNDTADNMKKYGGFIPGIRAGRPTAEYLGYVINRLSSVGALYLGILSLVPLIAFARWNASQNFPLGGASILIVVGVGLETVKQIESKLQQHRYEGFLH